MLLSASSSCSPASSSCSPHLVCTACNLERALNLIHYRYQPQYTRANLSCTLTKSFCLPSSLSGVISLKRDVSNNSAGLVPSNQPSMVSNDSSHPSFSQQRFVGISQQIQRSPSQCRIRSRIFGFLTFMMKRSLCSLSLSPHSPPPK